MHFLVTCQPQSSKSSNKKNRENKQREEFNLYCKKGKSDSDKNLWIKLPTLSIINGITLKVGYILNGLI